MKAHFTLTALAATMLSTAAMAEGTTNNTGSMNQNRTSETQSMDSRSSSTTQGQNISQLPASGQVTVSGTVTETAAIGDGFTLKDSTGEVEVNPETETDISVNVGDEVLVSGEIDETMLGNKEIAANRVSVTSRASDEVSQN